MAIYVNTITADRLSQAYFDDIRVLGAYSTFKEAIEEGRKQLKFYLWWNKGKINWRIHITSYTGNKSQLEGTIVKIKNRYQFNIPTLLGSYRTVPLKKVQTLEYPVP